MKLFLLGIGKTLGKLSAYLISYGSLGLFISCVLDSSFVPLPSAADAFLLILSAANPHRMPLYVLIATVGSTIGCLVLYYVSRRAGSRALAKFSEKKQRRVRELIDKYDVLSVLVACLLPPPFPLKLFVITTGVLRINVMRFTLAITAGRVVRYLLIGYLAARYGEHAKMILARYYPWIGLGLAVAVVAFVVIKSLITRKAQTNSEPGLEAGN